MLWTIEIESDDSDLKENVAERNFLSSEITCGKLHEDLSVLREITTAELTSYYYNDLSLEILEIAECILSKHFQK